MNATLDEAKIRQSVTNAQPTRKGDILADKLNPYIGTTHEIRVTCALICRYATKLHRLAEEGCNGPWWNDNESRYLGTLYRSEGASDRFKSEQAKHSAKMDRWQTEIDALQETTEARMRWLVEFLPQPTDPETLQLGHAWTLDAENDPRGCSVINGPAFVHGDSWGDRNGVCVP